MPNKKEFKELQMNLSIAQDWSYHLKSTAIYLKMLNRLCKHYFGKENKRKMIEMLIQKAYEQTFNNNE